MDSRPTFYEFFAGGGMARAGLDRWDCLFANDFDEMKALAYAANWGDDHLICRDVAKILSSELPGVADLAWASFPCQDLSLAGEYRGLGNSASAVLTRSGTFWPFWNLIKSLRSEGRAPRTIVLENVFGALTSRGGQDFSAICSALSDGGYRYGAIVVDARYFVPQSRQRVFFIAVDKSMIVPKSLASPMAHRLWHPPALMAAYRGIPEDARKDWIWWNLSRPAVRNTVFADLIEDNPSDVRWNTEEETRRLLDMMTPTNRAKVDTAKHARRKTVGGVYKRTRVDETGVKRQRAEVRFDDVSGCLRTPSGGSSRQTILVVDGDMRWSRNFGQSVKLFPFERRTGFYGQGYAEAIHV
jgi:DNA (cytosine-5)-methyltransferase 1